MAAAHAAHSKAAADAITMLQQRLQRSQRATEKQAEKNSKLREDLGTMRGVVAEMKKALQRVIDENADIKAQLDKAQGPDGELARCQMEVEALRKELEDTRTQSEAALLEERQRREKAEAAVDKAEALISEAAAMRETIEQNMQALVEHRMATETSMRGAGDRQLRRSVAHSMQQAEDTLRTVLEFSATLSDGLSDALLSRSAQRAALGGSCPPPAPPLLGGGPPSGRGVLGGVKPLATVSNNFRHRASAQARAGTKPGHVLPGGGSLVRRVRQEGKAGTERLVSVIASLEDEIAVLDDRHDKLLREAQELSDEVEGVRVGTDAEEGGGMRESAGGERTPAAAAAAARLEEVTLMVGEVQKRMRAKGQQVQQLRTLAAAARQARGR
ncbi:unnamed protein product [Pedinophyceae sp. YPF-701]|nr:unnamed protein product [Pedinophyceae sp. YPF-701]